MHFQTPDRGSISLFDKRHPPRPAAFSSKDTSFFDKDHTVVMDPSASGEAIADEFAASLVQRLREDQPFMSADIIREAAEMCRNVIKNAVGAE